jgi:hypothetical protein
MWKFYENGRPTRQAAWLALAGIVLVFEGRT